jgi:hypothetical protein
MAGRLLRNDAGSAPPVRICFHIVLYWTIILTQLPKCPLLVLPGELWQDIMAHLSKSDLKAFATAHRFIRFHALPLLYRRVTINTLWPTAYEKAKGLVETPHILKWVNALIILAPLDDSHFHFTRNTEIFNMFVTSFSKMPNLRELKLTRIHLSARAQVKILETPLISFACNDCEFTSEQLAPGRVRQSSVTTLQLSLQTRAEFPHPAFLNNFVNVETLDLTLPHEEYTRFPIFPSLTSLIMRSAITLSTFLIIFRQSPYLTRLRCSQRSLRLNEGAPIEISGLQHVEGRIPALIQLLGNPGLKSIVILASMGDVDNQCGTINGLLSAIKRGSAQQITSLDITAWFQNQEQPTELLEKLADAVPNLSRFTLRVDPCSIRPLVASPQYHGSARLPKLESLTVSIDLLEKDYFQPQVIPEDIVEPFAREFLEALVRPICPSLQVVWIFPWYDSFRWPVLEGEGTTWRFERRD